MSDLSVRAHVRVCLGVCVEIIYMYGLECPHVCPLGQRRIPVVPLCGSPPWSLEAGSLTEPGVRLMAIKSRQFSLSVSGNTGIVRMCGAMSF